MPSYTHKKLIQQIRKLDALPDDPPLFAEWVGAGAHLEFLRRNAEDDEIIIYGSGSYTFIHSLAVPNKVLNTATKDDLLGWSCNPYTSIASYTYGGAQDEMRVDRSGCGRGSKALSAGTDLIFARTIEGIAGDNLYFELNQEYGHLTGIHWLPEEGAYCKFDRHGDLRRCVSVTARSGSSDTSLVSFAWTELEEYLSIAQCSLVRMFDFTLLRRSMFFAWPDVPEQVFEESDAFFYRQRHCGTCAYTRGVQIITPSRDHAAVKARVIAGWHGESDKQYVEFIAHDWRNDVIRKICTNPADTTNYFEAENNDKLFELSPAFFKPEVLSKYKTDREKYTVGDRDINCRAAWTLRGYDVNEAGQVHAYICDLRKMPYSEQLHWLSFNEEPQAPISKRAVINDFRGEFVTFQEPRAQVLSVLGRWQERGTDWWVLRDTELLNRANTPLTASKDEWAEAVMDLAKLVVEGFQTKTIRQQLDSLGASYADKDQTISLLQTLVDYGCHLDNRYPLSALREAQRIGSKVKGHVGGSEAREIAKAAISEHGSYKDHFNDLCKRVSLELEEIGLQFELPRGRA